MNLPSMAMPAASHRSTALQALTVFSVLAVLVADVGGRHHACHPFSCGVFSNLSHPFRRQGDSPHCGPYELVCSATNATIHIGGGTYYVASINYTGSYFWVVDTDLGMHSSCPLPRWDNHADGSSSWKNNPLYFYPWAWATFLNCSQEINEPRYRPVRCLSTTDSFIYVLMIGNSYNPASTRNFKPSCGYLAMTPLGGLGITVPEDASYEDVVKVMRTGFSHPFPFSLGYRLIDGECVADSIRFIRKEHQIFGHSWD